MILTEEKRRAALRLLRRNWDQAARDNAQYSVVTIPGQSVEEFFASGEAEVEWVLNRLDTMGVESGRELALDFGCGLGRLSVALAKHYNHVVGLDVSGEMIARAKQASGVRYVRADTLEGLSARSYDLVYTNITLQHMPGWLQQQYVTDFYRLVRANGVVVFELPDWPDMERVQHALAMSGAGTDEVRSWIETAGGELLAIDKTESAGPSIPCYRYISTRRQ